MIKKILTIFTLAVIALFGASALQAAGVAAPSNLTATAVSTSQINLVWQDNADNETGFKIERSLDGSSFTVIATVGANVTSYSNTGLASSTTYYYRVRAYKGTKNITYSSYSNTASATTFSPIPLAPTNLWTNVISGTSTPTSTNVYIQWQDNSNNEQYFSLERSTDAINFSEIAQPTYRWYSDYSVVSSTTYYYRVRAYNQYGYSGYSNVDDVTIP